MVALKGNAMASLYDKVAQRWNSNQFSTASAAQELAKIGQKEENRLNNDPNTVERINKDFPGFLNFNEYHDEIEQQLLNALNFQSNTPYMRPRARPLSFSEQVNSYSEAPTGNIPKGSALEGNWAAYVPKDLIFTESSNRWDADTTDSKGRRFVGALQFGQSRLNDLIKAGVLPKGTTLDMLKNNKDMQVKAGNWHFKDYINRINKNNLAKYIGTTLPGQDKALTMNSLLAMAHLGGFGGMSKALRSSGSYNPSDSLGTSLTKYAYRHAN